MKNNDRSKRDKMLAEGYLDPADFHKPHVDINSLDKEINYKFIVNIMNIKYESIYDLINQTLISKFVIFYKYFNNLYGSDIEDEDDELYDFFIKRNKDYNMYTKCSQFIRLSITKILLSSYHYALIQYIDNEQQKPNKPMIHSINMITSGIILDKLDRYLNKLVNEKYFNINRWFVVLRLCDKISFTIGYMLFADNEYEADCKIVDIYHIKNYFNSRDTINLCFGFTNYEECQKCEEYVNNVIIPNLDLKNKSVPDLIEDIKKYTSLMPGISHNDTKQSLNDINID